MAIIGGNSTAHLLEHLLEDAKALEKEGLELGLHVATSHLGQTSHLLLPILLGLGLHSGNELLLFIRAVSLSGGVAFHPTEHRSHRFEGGQAGLLHFLDDGLLLTLELL